MDGEHREIEQWERGASGVELARRGWVDFEPGYDGTWVARVTRAGSRELEK